MHSTYSVRHLARPLLLALFVLSLNTPSIAQDLAGTAESAIQNSRQPDSDAQIATVNVQQKSVAITVDAITNSEATPSSLPADNRTEAETLRMQAKAVAHLKAMLTKKDVEKVKTVSPYEQLVKLAFKGKGENGINSYEDAATLFCQQARDDNNAAAQFALGWMHAKGKGFNKDENIAAFFYHKAAAQDNYRAKKSLVDFNGDEKLAQIPTCMLPDAPLESRIAGAELAPAGSNGNAFYERGPIFDIVDRLAPQFHIETDLAMAFIKVESNFNPKATSPKNAQGLMQLIPATSKRFNVKNPYNPEDNIKGGLAYLQWLMAYFEGDVRLVAAAYNAGEGAVNRYKGVPPYRETRKYVKKIYKLYRKSYHPFRDDLLVGERSAVIQISRNN